MIKRLLLVVDLAIIVVSFLLSYYLLPVYRPLIIPNVKPVLSPLTSYLWLLLLIIPLWILFLYQNHMYTELSTETFVTILARAALSIILGLSLLSLVLFLLKIQTISRMLIVGTAILGFAMHAGVRVAIRAYSSYRQKHGFYTRYLLLIGSHDTAQTTFERIKRHAPPLEYEVVGYLSLSGDSSEKEGKIPCLGSVNELPGVLSRHEIDRVIITHFSIIHDSLVYILENCEETGRPVTFLPDYLDSYRRENTIFSIKGDNFFGLPAITLTTTRERQLELFAKRMMDIAASAILLLLLSPLFLVIAAAIKLTSPGPVFYRWQVIGRNNREFTSYKFRSMVVEAGRMKAALEKYNEMKGPVFKMTDDPRVTPLGRILRKYSIDELPQLWSVLKGEMSLVGPRPVFRSELERYEFWQRRKLSVRPGMTCLWQVGGRNVISDFSEWVRLDLEYIDNWSLWLDLKILALTALAVVKGTGK